MHHASREARARSDALDNRARGLERSGQNVLSGPCAGCKSQLQLRERDKVSLRPVGCYCGP
eukprot:9487834-Pyramimonas_sp.AAC.1